MITPEENEFWMKIFIQEHMKRIYGFDLNKIDWRHWDVKKMRNNTKMSSALKIFGIKIPEV